MAKRTTPGESPASAPAEQAANRNQAKDSAQADGYLTVTLGRADIHHVILGVIGQDTTIVVDWTFLYQLKRPDTDTSILGKGPWLVQHPTDCWAVSVDDTILLLSVDGGQALADFIADGRLTVLADGWPSVQALAIGSPQAMQLGSTRGLATAPVMANA